MRKFDETEKGVISARPGALLCHTASALAIGLLLTAAGDRVATAQDADPDDWTVTEGAAPGSAFDISQWKITLPELDPERGKAAEIEDDEIASYANPRWFYLDGDTGAMVFKAPNKMATTPNSSNTRSELRGMIRAGDTGVGTREPRNNWVIETNPEANKFAAIGGKMSATLAVDWVSTSGDDSQFGAHAAIIGQIHGAGKMEPLKIFYRKLPGHEKGSIFWNYESHPANEDDRQDVSNDIWGSHALTASDEEPADGIALGERFSYEVNVTGTIMELSFVKEDGTNAIVQHDLNEGHEALKGDEGYSTDWMYFKAGVYNPCNTGNSGCENRGQEAGDYAQVSFFEFSIDYPDTPS